MKNVLLIVGSLRENSHNRKLAKKIETILGDRAKVSFLDYADLPFMNQDLEFPPPESVARVRAAVQEADGIWICSPEYNFQIPGVLKNLLDWLSRPLAPNDWERGSAVRGKAVTISSVAGKSGGVGVRKNLSALLEVMSMKVVSGTGTGVALDGVKLAAAEPELTRDHLDALAAQAEAFLSAI